MPTNDPSQSQVDGIVSPSSEPEGATLTVPTVPQVTVSRSSVKLSMIVLGIFVFLYILAGFVLMAIFPRPDASLAQLKLLSTTSFAIVGLVSLLLGFISFIRISSVKDHPRLKMLALIRVAIVLLPVILVSVLVPVLINAQPRLILEVLSPSSTTSLMAPVTVTFGMPTALKVFSLNHLTPLKYEWDFNGDGAVDQETFDPQVTYTFQKQGVFSVLSRVTMVDGQTKTVSIRLVIPRAGFRVQPASPVIDETATFSLEHLFPKSSDPKVPTVLKARWDFDGDGTVDVETNKLDASFVYHKLGPVIPTVSLTLSNQTQTSLSRSLDVVKAPEQPFPITLETEPAMLLGPPPFGVLFTLKTKEPIASASWDFGNQKTLEGLRVAQVFSTVGNFTVTVAVRSQSGATAHLSKVIRVTNPLLISDLTFTGTPEVRGSDIVGEAPLSVDITPVTSQPLISFSWDVETSDDISAPDKTLHAIYRDPGTYTADLIGIDADQNVFRRRMKITVKPPQSFVKITMVPESATAPATIKFDASDAFIPNEDITGFEWDFGDQSSANGTKFSGALTEHIFEKPGNYNITLRVRTTAGNVYTDQKTLVVRAPLIDACFLASRSSGKAPLGVSFDPSCSTGNVTSWLWNFGDASESDIKNPSHVFVTPGTYTVTLTMTTADGLKSTKRSTITVTDQ